MAHPDHSPFNLGHLDGKDLGDERGHYPDGRPWPSVAAVPTSSQRHQEPQQREGVVEFIDSHCHIEKVLLNFHQPSPRSLPSLRSLEESLPVAGTAVHLRAVSNFVFTADQGKPHGIWASGCWLGGLTHPTPRLLRWQSQNHSRGNHYFRGTHPTPRLMRWQPQNTPGGITSYRGSIRHSVFLS